jgi:enamine deaminase RidA (YjgF/YER057c/UK114 family)
MPTPRFLVPKGVGEQMRDNFHYSQGVQLGDMVYVTGQGAWTEQFSFSDDVHEQVRQAFRNVEIVLAEAGASWQQVIDITSYHVQLDEAVLGTMVEELRTHCPNHQPLWTVIGVASLALPQMQVEITATAVTGS